MRLPIPKDLVINFSGMIFMGVAGFLAWDQGRLGQLFSAEGILFLLGGVLCAGILIGWPIGRLHRYFCLKVIEREQGDLSAGAMQVIRHSGTAAMVIQIVLVYLITERAFGHFFRG